MHALTEDELRGAFVNATAEDLRLLTLPHDFALTEWDHQDFFAWRDPRASTRGYLVTERDGELTAVVVTASNATRSRSAMCNLCRTMQPGGQVALFSARRAGEAGERGDSVGTYICADLSCHENVRLAAPLAPGEIRAYGIVDLRIDGTRRNVESFVARVAESVTAS